MLPEPIKKFIEIFSTLPSIGTRQATRLAFKLISSGRAKIDETAKAVDDLRYLKTCANCFFVHQNRDNLCDICRDSNRRQDIIAIVEKETDLISLERTKKFKGRYLVLGELSKTGVLESIQKLRLNHLEDWIKKQGGQAEEIIIAINPTTFGDLNASMIAKELTPFAKKISRLGRGIPTGGEIEFADEETLGQALDRRT
jgi:recombination protein RecR